MITSLRKRLPKKHTTFIYHFLLLLLCMFCTKSKAQINNPCGVVARISPSAADSVVAVNTFIPFKSTSTNATEIRWLLNGFFSGITGPEFNRQITAGVHTIGMVASNGNCTDTTTVVYFAAGIAHDIDSLLLANYGTYGLNEEGTCIDETVDKGGFVLGGVQYLYSSCGEAGIVVKLRDKGCIDWSKKLLSPYYCNNSKVNIVHASADTNYYVVTNNIELARLDKGGNILWNKRFEIGDRGPSGIQYVAGDPQGAVYTIGGAFNNGWMITKLDKNGSVTWNKFYRLSYDEPGGPDQSEFAVPSGMVWLKGKIYVCGNAYSKKNSTYFSFITKLDAVTGAKEWQYGYTDPEFPGAVGFTHLALYDTLLMASSGAQGQMVTLIDQQGLVRKSIKTQFYTSYGPKVSRAGADSKGHIYMMQWTNQALPLQPYFQYYSNFAEIDTALTKYWGMVFSSSSRSFFADAAMGSDNKFGAIGQDFGFVDDGNFGSRDMRFLKVDTINSAPNCSYNYNDNDYTIAAKTINRLNFQYLIDSSFTIIPADGTPYTTTDAYIQSRYTCPDFLDSCSFMKITGPVSMCSVADTYTYRVHRNKKCALVPKWTLPPGVTIVNQTDSTLSVKFPALGVYTIVSTLNSCIPVKDSLVIIIASKSMKLNLGADTVICNNGSIVLHAGPGFITYKWKDGSIDSVLNVTRTNIYWVEVADSCGNILRDSIRVNPFNFPISIGADRVKCNNDTVHLDAPTGFLKYEWSNNYNISSTDLQGVVVNPLVDTVYYIKAEISPGCFAFDTVRISVKASPAISLGADKSFCSGDSAVPDAGNGFASYLWSNGKSGKKIAVYTEGEYSVVATTNDGCKSYDTLRIVKVWPLPVVNLDNNRDLCSGTTRTLRAGNYSSYAWHDGSKAASYTVSTIGTYYVTVTDNNQCKGSDTVKIVRVLPVPSRFLPADTAICNYGDVVLFPRQTYSSYLWNTGQTGSSITVKQPGLYWLQVTDQNNCKGIDSLLVVPKQCMTGLYVPTAFSPNSDGKNDMFKALLFGNILKFQWTIYNRFGQVVFTSASASNGWDGTFNGAPQNSGNYVWTCHYQLQGETEKTKSGSVVLLR